MIRRQDDWPTAPIRSRAWVALGWFWVAMLGSLVAGAVVLQLLGPPPPRARLASAEPAPAAAHPQAVQAAAPPPPPAEASAPEHARPAQSVAPAPSLTPAEPVPVAPPLVPPAAVGGVTPVPAPLAALQEPAPDTDGGTLPRIGANGKMPMQAYAAAYDQSDKRPRVAVLLAGIGMAEIDSDEAIRATPAAISLAISPYAPRPARLLEVARATGHETLVSLPMEPLGYPLNDAGNRSLLTGLAPAQNHDRLVWALSRISGYVGATAAMSGLRGERFAASEQMSQVLDELAWRGLLYVDPRPVPQRPGAPLPARPGQRVADLLIDDPPVRSEIEAKLSRLEQLAHDRGSALGVAGLPGPVTVERLAAWATTLGSRNIALVPVSALVPPLPLPTSPVASPAR